MGLVPGSGTVHVTVAPLTPADAFTVGADGTTSPNVASAWAVEPGTAAIARAEAKSFLPPDHWSAQPRDPRKMPPVSSKHSGSKWRRYGALPKPRKVYWPFAPVVAPLEPPLGSPECPTRWPFESKATTQTPWRGWCEGPVTVPSITASGPRTPLMLAACPPAGTLKASAAAASGLLFQ